MLTLLVSSRFHCLNNIVPGAQRTGAPKYWCFLQTYLDTSLIQTLPCYYTTIEILLFVCLSVCAYRQQSLQRPHERRHQKKPHQRCPLVSQQTPRQQRTSGQRQKGLEMASHSLSWVQRQHFCKKKKPIIHLLLSWKNCWEIILTVNFCSKPDGHSQTGTILSLCWDNAEGAKK